MSIGCPHLMDPTHRTLLDRNFPSSDSSGEPLREELGREQELDLVERAQAGERAAFGILARAHYRRIFVTARHLVANHEDAEDLAQETFVRAHGALLWYRGEGRFGGWLRRILVHLAHDRFRRLSRAPAAHSLEALVSQGFPDPRSGRTTATEVGARELEGLVERSIQGLPVRLRLPLVLRTLDGLDYDEIAAATGVTSATARTQVMQARRALARLLARYLGADEGGRAQ